MLDSGKCTLVQNKVLENIIREKGQRRKDLSELSFKEKIHILVQLQNMARGVTKQGREIINLVSFFHDIFMTS
jgi:hypothetical protein